MTRGWLIVSLWAITGTVCLATPPQLKPGVERWPVKTRAAVVSREPVSRVVI
jgi:hypothetical protein